MKKTLYYLSPFIIFPIWVSLELLLDNLWRNPLVSYIFIGSLLVFSAFFGILTPKKEGIDFRITFLVPLSFFLTMFVVGFFDTGTCSGEPRLDFGDAFRMSIRFWFIYVFMALITFFACCIKIRILKRKIKTA